MVTSTFNAYDAADAVMYASNATYSTARNSATGTIGAASATHWAGQRLLTGTYTIFRSAFFFDLIGIPANATISAASLYIYVTDVQGTDDVVIMSGQDSYPANPVVAANYAISNYSGDYGSASWSGWGTSQYHEIPFDTFTILRQGDQTKTKFVLVSQNDIDSSPPSGLEYIKFDSVDGTYPPYLTITYTVPNTNVKTSTGDGYMYKSNATYNTAWTATTADGITGGMTLEQGQNYSGGNYYVYRNAMYFDTSAVSGVIGSAKLWFVPHSIATASGDPKCQIVSGMPTYPSSPLVVGDFNKSYYSGNGGQSAAASTMTEDAWNYIELNQDGIDMINKGGTTKLLVRTDREIAGTTPTGSEYVPWYSADYQPGAESSSYYAPYLEIEILTSDTSVIKDYAYQLFAHRTISNADNITNPKGSKIGYVRLYDSSGDYIQLPIMRNYANEDELIFDDTGGNEADPVYTSVTQYYEDLKLYTIVPRFNKVFDVSTGSWGYAGSTFTVADYDVFNEGGNALMESSGAVTGWVFSKGTRYIVYFTVRIFNDMVEQTLEEGTRCIVTQHGLSVIQRRMLHDGSPQPLGKPPIYIGVGGKGPYYIVNASDFVGTYDFTADTYAAIAGAGYHLFPNASTQGDCFCFCRDDTYGDQIEGLQFDNLDSAAQMGDGGALIWEYYSETIDDWAPLSGVDDQTNTFLDDGTIRWNVPTDADPAASPDGSNTGYWYRCRVTGNNGWNIMPSVTNGATDVKPLVMRVQHTETDLQMPFNNKLADVIIAPHTGTVGKVSAEFGMGGIPELTRESDGTFLAASYHDLREVGIFTASGITEGEEVALGEITATPSSGQITFTQTGNPRPLKLLRAIKTSNGEIFYGNDRLLSYTTSGGNYIVDTPFLSNSVQYDITYLGKRITPSQTPNNILSISGNVRNVVGPDGVWVYAHMDNPANTSLAANTMLSPRHIKFVGNLIYQVEDESIGPLSPNFARSPGDRGVRVLAADLVYPMGLEGPLVNGPGFTSGSCHAGNRQFRFTFDVGYPMIMAKFNMNRYDRVHNPKIIVGASGYSEVSNDTRNDHVYNILAWGQGDPTARTASERQTGWKLLGSSTPVAGGKGLPDYSVVGLDMEYDDRGSNEWLDEQGYMHILIVPSSSVRRAKRHNMDIRVTEADMREMRVPLNKAIANDATWRSHHTYGDLAVNYVGLVMSPVSKASEGSFSFRRGIDWTYYPGDTEAKWRIDNTKGDNSENYAVTSRGGEKFFPVLPSARLNKKTEYFYFGASPSSPTNVKLYLEYPPVDTAGVYIEEQGGEKQVTTNNGKITVNSVGWDSTKLWNDVDDEYSDDHNDDSGPDGTGAGYVDITFATKDWTASAFRTIKVDYIYYGDPEITTTYLMPNDTMFARSIFHQLSHSNSLHPFYGDRVRFYFEVQFEAKRVA